MSNSMFYTGLSGLNAAQAALVTTGHNTANVNTPGYSRQAVQISASGGASASGSGYLGNGVRVSDITRSYDQYLSSQLNQAESLNQSLTVYGAQISQIDNLLASQTSGLAPQMQTLFAHVQAVANTPADPSARQQMIGSTQALASQFRAMDSYLNGMNANVNSQVSGMVQQINTYAGEIASLNSQVAMFGNASGRQAPNDLLDQRDQLVTDLGKLVGTKVVMQDGGQFNVFIGNGQTLVLGGKATSLAAVSSASDPGRTTLASVNPAGKVMPMNESIINGGALGGLLRFRDETLSPALNSVGRMAISLADTFNSRQKLGIDLNGNPGSDFLSQSSPTVLSHAGNSQVAPGGALSATFAEVGRLTLSDYRVDATGPSAFKVTRLSDNAAVAADPVTGAYDGLALAFTGGAAGDSFLVQPTRTGARDLAVKVVDPAKVAAASPLVTSSTLGNKGSAAISPPKVDAGYPGSPTQLSATGLRLTYDSATSSFSGLPAGVVATASMVNGAPVTTLAFDGISFSISGIPANGDTFTLGKNTGGVSDGSNALLLGALQNQKTMAGGTASFNDAYAQLVSTVGNKARQVQISGAAQASLTLQVRTAQQSVSGVNQDEETANLLMFQQMYQANAKVIQTASTLFDTVLGISR